MGTLIAFSVGVSLWLAYGVAIRSAPIILSNSVTLAESAFLVVMKLRERR